MSGTGPKGLSGFGFRLSVPACSLSSKKTTAVFFVPVQALGPETTLAIYLEMVVQPENYEL